MQKTALLVTMFLSISSCGSISGQTRAGTEFVKAPEASVLGEEGIWIGIFKDSEVNSLSDPGKPDLWQVTGWEVQELSTADEAEYLDDLEKDVILHLNMARTDPARYAQEFVEPRNQYFTGTVYREQGEPMLLTLEGSYAVDDCVKDMNDTEPMDPLLPSEDICLAALDHAMDLSIRGETGHIGSDGSEFSARIERYGEWHCSIGEAISYGPSTGREIVIGLLIDDGVPDRGHRATVLNPSFRLLGISIEDHSAYGNVCVIEFAAGFVSARI